MIHGLDWPNELRGKVIATCLRWLVGSTLTGYDQRTGLAQLAAL